MVKDFHMWMYEFLESKIHFSDIHTKFFREKLLAWTLSMITKIGIVTIFE